MWIDTYLRHGGCIDFDQPPFNQFDCGRKALPCKRTPSSNLLRVPRLHRGKRCRSLPVPARRARRCSCTSAPAASAQRSWHTCSSKAWAASGLAEKLTIVNPHAGRTPILGASRVRLHLQTSRTRCGGIRCAASRKTSFRTNRTRRRRRRASTGDTLCQRYPANAQNVVAVRSVSTRR